MGKNEVALIEKKVSPLVLKAEKFVINSPEAMREATAMLSEMNKYGDAIKKEKEKITKPLNEALKVERKRWAPLEDMWDRGIGALRKTMSAYQTAEKKRADDEAAAIVNRVGDGKGKLKTETAVRKLGEIEAPEESVSTDMGTVKFKTVRKFEVVDITLLPKEYLLPNEVEIRAAMKAGVELPGVKYFDEEVPVNYR